jgi:hypothetical protein
MAFLACGLTQFMAEHHSGKYAVATIRTDYGKITFLIPLQVAPLFCSWKQLTGQSSSENIWRHYKEWIKDDLSAYQLNVGDQSRIACSTNITIEQHMEFVRAAMLSFAVALHKKLPVETASKELATAITTFEEEIKCAHSTNCSPTIH